MFPDQHNHGGGVNPVPQQAPNGQYEVVPPLPVANATGHNGHNPYEFIVNPEPTGSRINLFRGGSFARPLLFLAAVFIVLAIVAAIAVSLLAPKGPIAGLTSIAQRQQEIMRVSAAGTQQAGSQDTKNFVANVDTVVASSQAQVLSYLTSHHTKLKDKQLGVDQNAQTDAFLANAQTSNTYDVAVVSNLTDQLNTYQSLLQSTYKATSNAQLKQTLQNSANANQLLLEQAKSIQK